MQADIRLAKPEETEFTLTVTLSLAGWRRLHKQLTESAAGTNFPANDLRIAIVQLVENAQARVSANFAEQSDS